MSGTWALEVGAIPGDKDLPSTARQPKLHGQLNLQDHNDSQTVPQLQLLPLCLGKGATGYTGLRTPATGFPSNSCSWCLSIYLKILRQAHSVWR